MLIPHGLVLTKTTAELFNPARPSHAAPHHPKPPMTFFHCLKIILPFTIIAFQCLSAHSAHRLIRSVDSGLYIWPSSYSLHDCA